MLSRRRTFAATILTGVGIAVSTLAPSPQLTAAERLAITDRDQAPPVATVKLWRWMQISSDASIAESLWRSRSPLHDRLTGTAWIASTDIPDSAEWTAEMRRLLAYRAAIRGGSLVSEPLPGRPDRVEFDAVAHGFPFRCFFRFEITGRTSGSVDPNDPLDPCGDRAGRRVIGGLGLPCRVWYPALIANVLALGLSTFVLTGIAGPVRGRIRATADVVRRDRATTTRQGD